jgi:multidrug transporter EmrE-like cation transporter
MSFYIYVALCILLTGVGQLFLKLGSRNGQGLLGMYINPYTLSGYAIFFLVTIASVLALRGIELKAFYAFMALNYVAIALLSTAFLKETLSKNRAIAIALIVFGVAVFNL